MSHAFPRRALVSVSDKQGLGPFVQGLVQLGFEILSTGGTARYLKEHGAPVLDVAEYTGFPEIMDGRVKTLHPKVHGALLGRLDHARDVDAIRQHGIAPIELVVCNLYPFESTIAADGISLEEAVEQIDIGGPSMLRAAAKNHAFVAVVTDPSQYDAVLSELKAGPLSDARRRELAWAAFQMTARYDRAIAGHLGGLISGEGRDSSAFPEQLTLEFHRRLGLRYGENPHQQAAFYAEPDVPLGTLASSKQLHGKELSYNNLLDLEAALSVVREFSEPAAVVIKHNNPCGCAVGDSLSEAFERAHAGDPVSAFGSVIAVNRPVDEPTAERLCEPGRFIEVILAPAFEPSPFEMLTTRPKWKKSVRLVECAGLIEPRDAGLDLRRISGGLLVQNRDESAEPFDEWRCVTQRLPTEGEQTDLRFAWPVAKHVRSNAIVFARERAVVGVGAGQMSRLDAVYLAAYKAGDRSQEAVLASDAFFPFRDGVDRAAAAGVTAVIQPGGSRGDEEVVAACDEHNMAMIFTGRRHFRH